MVKEYINYKEKLSDIKNKMVNKEPIFTGAKSRTPELLQGSMSKKLLRYLIKEHGESNSFKKYLGDTNNEQNFNKIKEILDTDGDLSSINALSIDNLYKKILMIAPLTESGDSRVYGRIAKDASCTGKELENATKLLGSYRDKVHQKFLKQAE